MKMRAQKTSCDPGKIAVLLVWSFQMTLCGWGGQHFENLVGHPPVCTSLLFKDWLDTLVARRLQEVPLQRRHTCYFSQAGDDRWGDGSRESPWKSLAKAQQILNQWENGELALLFRCGDVWTEEVVLEARISAMTSKNLHLDPSGFTVGGVKSAWHPQKGFSYELDNGAIQERVYLWTFDPVTGQAQIKSGQRLQATNHTMLRFKCALVVWKPDVTIGSYIDSSSGQLTGSKPRFSTFRLCAGHSLRDFTARRDSFTNTYSWVDRSMDAVGWFKRRDCIDWHYRRVRSIGEVEANAGTWYYDRTNRTVHFRDWHDQPPNQGGAAWEWCPTNAWSGVVVADVDGVRLDSLRIEGWGFPDPEAGAANRAYNGYGIKSEVSGANRVVYTHCEAYYNNRHPMGNVSDGPGGIWTCAYCSWGFSFEAGSVSYATFGGQEAIFYRCQTRAGNVLQGAQPFSGYRAFGSSSHHFHTGGGDNYIRLFVSYGCENIPHLSMSGWIGTGDAPPLEGDLANCRVFSVEDHYRIATVSPVDLSYLSSDGSPGRVAAPFGNRIAYINGTFESGVQWPGNPANTDFPAYAQYSRFLQETYLLNCRLHHRSLSSARAGVRSQAHWALQGLRAFHCQFAMELAPGCLEAGFTRSDLPAADLIVQNSLISFHGLDAAMKCGESALRMRNASDRIGNNAYSGLTLKSDPQRGSPGAGDDHGYDADGDGLDFPSLPVNVRPEGLPSLVTTTTRLIDGVYRLEFDHEWRPRARLALDGRPVAAIGPFEPAVLPPLILSREEEVTALPGQDVILRINAAGDAPLAFQWYLDSQWLAGATNQYLSLPGIQWPQAGQYRLIVSNRFGLASSSIRLVMEPSGSLRLVSIQARANEPVRLSAWSPLAVDCLLESSTDLVQWRTLSSLRLDPDLARFNGREPATNSACFYRLRILGSTNSAGKRELP